MNSADEIAPLLKQRTNNRKSPFVIEFSGTPKAGKSTLLDSIATYLRREGLRVLSLKNTVPVEDKVNITYNIWGACNSLCKLIESDNSTYNFILVDRGFLDALIWIDVFRVLGIASIEDNSFIDAFFLHSSWTRMLSLYISMEIDPSIALQRESQFQFSQKLGSIMNSKVLGCYNERLDIYRSKFQKASISTLHINATEGLETQLIAARVFQRVIDLIGHLDSISL